MIAGRVAPWEASALTAAYDGKMLGPPALAEAVGAAQERLELRARSLAPLLGERLTAWMRRLAPQGRAERYFLHPEAFPSLLLPWLMEASLSASAPGAEARDLVYSTIAGYYFIRLVDNVMDGEATGEVALLPAAAFLHAEFERPYHAVFAVDNRFWIAFDETWARTAEAAIEDSVASAIDRDSFEAMAARKVLAVRIPMIAVARRLTGTDVPPEWERVLSCLSLFHQMRNDLFDWQRDDDRGATTYFLCEARRRRAAHEQTVGWLAREGFDWGLGVLDGWLGEAQAVAGRIGSAELQAYLARRRRDLAAAAEEMRPGLAAVAALAAAARTA
jgi:hypothetical protein